MSDNLFYVGNPTDQRAKKLAAIDEDTYMWGRGALFTLLSTVGIDFKIAMSQGFGLWENVLLAAASLVLWFLAFAISMVQARSYLESDSARARAITAGHVVAVNEDVRRLWTGALKKAKVDLDDAEADLRRQDAVLYSLADELKYAYGAYGSEVQRTARVRIFSALYEGACEVRGAIERRIAEEQRADLEYAIEEEAQRAIKEYERVQRDRAAMLDLTN